jgi:multifunctional beta-oxidation protein
MEILDKGKAASVTFVVETKDKVTGNVIFENQGTVFIRGSGGFGGKKKGNGTIYEIQKASLRLSHR